MYLYFDDHQCVCHYNTIGAHMPYYIFEGPDGAGKSTAIDIVADSLTALGCTVYKYAMPGSTKLGQHIRKLVKTPHHIDESITINDPVTRQLLYAADYSATMHDINAVLAKEPDCVVLADRCSAISSRIYGEADGADVGTLGPIYDAIPAPQANIMFVLLADPTETSKRMSGRPEDYFDQKNEEFKRKITQSYYRLANTSYHPMYLKVAKYLISIDATEPIYQCSKTVVDSIVYDLRKIQIIP